MRTSFKIVLSKNFPIFLILGLSLLIRLFYCYYRLDSHTGDKLETAYIISALKIIFSDGNPGWFFHGALYFNLLALFYSLIFFVGKILCLLETKADFLMFYLERPEVFYGAARGLNILIGVATILAVYRIGKILWSKEVGLYAALIFSLLPMSLQQSAKGDMYGLTNFLIVMVFLQGVKYNNNPSFGKLLATAVFLGLAFASDYFALLIVPFLLGLYLLADPRGRSVFIKGAVIFCGTVFFLIVLNNWNLVLRPNLVFDAIHRQFTVAVFNDRANLLMHDPFFYVKIMLSFPYLPFSVLAMLSAVLFVRERSRMGALLLILPALNILFFSFSKVENYRYIFFSFPYLSLAAGYTIAFFSKNRSKIIFTGFVLIWGASCLILNKPRIFSDFSSLEEWIKENIPVKTSIMIQPGIYCFAQTRLFSILHDNRSNENLYKEVLDRYLTKHPEENYRFWVCNLKADTIPTLALYGIEYIITPPESVYPPDIREWLSDRTTLIKSFSSPLDIGVLRNVQKMREGEVFGQLPEPKLYYPANVYKIKN